MTEAWIAFIVSCNLQMVCDGAPHYAKKANYSIQICRDEGRGWAVQMKALTGANYGFGCKKVDYDPPEVPAK